MHSGRRRGKARSRILYWFRTPPGVRVGRAALDEDAIRMIEQNNPHIQFDWTRILKGQGDPGEAPDRRERSPRPEPRRRPAAEPAPASPVAAEPGENRVEAAAEIAVVPESPTIVPDFDVVDVAVTPDIEPLPSLTSSDELDRLDQTDPPIDAGPDEGPVTAAHARLGSEGVSRLRARYADIMAGISDRVHDAGRAAELRAQAERLNPDCWVTEDEVRQGLEQYETVFDSLRSVVGRRRRRRRR